MLKQPFLFLCFFILAFFLYYNGWHIPYFYDDYEHIFLNPAQEILSGLFQANAYAHFYRPFERSILAIIQTFWAWETFPIRIFHLLLHATGAYFVYHVLRTWKVNFSCSLGGAMFVIVSQLSVYAVASNDTQSQIEGALLSALSLWLLYGYLGNRNQGTTRYYLSILTFFLALISKETSAGLLLGIPFLIFVLQNERRMKIQKTMRIFLPYGICFGIYLFLRFFAGGGAPAIGNSGYTFHFGINIVRNAGLFLVQAIIPVSSLSAARAAYSHNYFLLVLTVVFSGIFATVLGYGLWKSSRKKIVCGLCVLIFCSWIPVLFLNATNELYPYNMILFLGALFGISAEYYFTVLSNRPLLLRFGIPLIFLVSLLTNALGANEKTTAMKQLGNRAAALLPQIISAAKKAPQNSVMYFVNPKDSGFEYSEFSMRGFRVIAVSDSIVRYFASRPDLQFDICDSAECIREINSQPGVAYTYDIATLELYPWKH